MEVLVFCATFSTLHVNFDTYILEAFSFTVIVYLLDGWQK